LAASRLLSVFCLVLARLTVAAAFASAEEPYRVVVLQPAAPTERERELVARLKGELGAAGFAVFGLSLAPGGDPQKAVLVDGSELEPAAAFAIAERGMAAPAPTEASPRLQLWLSDRVKGGRIREVGEERKDSAPAQLLAVQGVELLQARVADGRWQPERDRLSRAPAPPLPVSHGGHFTTTVELAGLLQPSMREAALTPLVRVSYVRQSDLGLGFDVGLGARLSAAGLGPPMVLRASLREVEVEQSFALLEGVVAFDPDGWIGPFATLGAGAYQVSVEGLGREQAIGRSDATWSAAGALGLGLALSPFRPLVCELEAQGLFALHPTEVRVDAVEVASYGRPLFVLSIGLGVSL
jgi:hypothetical protein